MWFFAPAERLHALPVLRARLVDVARDRRRSHEADGRDVWMLEDRVDRDLVAVHDVEHAVGQAGFLQQLRDVDGRGRVLLGRLEDERVPAGDRRRPHPHGHHRREVEGRDPGHDAERLPDRVDVDPGEDTCSEKSPLSSVGIPQAYSITSSPRCTSPARVREHLPVLLREDRRDLALRVVDELPDREEELLALRERYRPPVLEAALRGLHRGVDLLDRGEIDLFGLNPLRRVVDGPASAGLPGTSAAADPVADPAKLAFGGPLGSLRHLGHCAGVSVARPGYSCPMAPRIAAVCCLVLALAGCGGGGGGGGNEAEGSPPELARSAEPDGADASRPGSSRNAPSSSSTTCTPISTSSSTASR